MSKCLLLLVVVGCLCVPSLCMILLGEEGPMPIHLSRGFAGNGRMKRADELATTETEHTWCENENNGNNVDNGCFKAEDTKVDCEKFKNNNTADGVLEVCLHSERVKAQDVRNCTTWREDLPACNRSNNFPLGFSKVIAQACEGFNSTKLDIFDTAFEVKNDERFVMCGGDIRHRFYNKTEYLKYLVPNEKEEVEEVAQVDAKLLNASGWAMKGWNIWWYKLDMMFKICCCTHNCFECFDSDGKPTDIIRLLCRKNITATFHAGNLTKELTTTKKPTTATINYDEYDEAHN